MTATEELRRMLDERGVEWKDYGYENHTWWGEWHAENRPSVNGLFLKVEGVVTPEQAVAATLGSGTCRYELKDGWYKCSNCGRSMLAFEGKGDPLYPPNFCPNCGARVEVDDG